MSGPFRAGTGCQVHSGQGPDGRSIQGRDRMAGPFKTGWQVHSGQRPDGRSNVHSGQQQDFGAAGPFRAATGFWCRKSTQGKDRMLVRQVHQGKDRMLGRQVHSGQGPDVDVAGPVSAKTACWCGRFSQDRD